MRTSHILFTASVFLVSACGSSPAPAVPADPLPSGSIDVSMTENGFEPASISVGKGQAVCWTNKHEGEARWPASDNHPTHELYPEFDPHTPVRDGTHWCFTFLKPGTWKYHDHLFPDFLGTVVVQ